MREQPWDLDAHLYGPTVAELDYDVTNAFGPEIITIHKLIRGEYSFLVHDFTNRSNSNSTWLARSKAKVKVYLNSNDAIIYEVDPTLIGSSWKVFKLNIAENGEITCSTWDK